jgi:hypothetical protein
MLEIFFYFFVPTSNEYEFFFSPLTHDLKRHYELSDFKKRHYELSFLCYFEITTFIFLDSLLELHLQFFINVQLSIMLFCIDYNTINHYFTHNKQA